MTAPWFNKLLEVSTTVGTTPYLLGGSPVGSGYRTIRSKFATAAVSDFWATSRDASKWEHFTGTLTYGTPDQLSRTLIESSTGSLISWTSDDVAIGVYVFSGADIETVGLGVTRGWLATTLSSLLGFGLGFKQDDISSGKHSLKLRDGAGSDIQIGVVDTAAHSFVLDPTVSAWRQLGTASAVAASSIDFTGIPSTINHIMVLFELRPGTDAVDIFMRTYGADGVLDVGGSDYFAIATLNDGSTVTPVAGTNSLINLAASVDNGDYGVGGYIIAANIQAATRTKFNYQTHFLDSSGSTVKAIAGSGDRQEADRITGLRIGATSGTITGKAILLGAV